jgi:hypothetical protein
METRLIPEIWQKGFPPRDRDNLSPDTRKGKMLRRGISAALARGHANV